MKCPKCGKAEMEVTSKANIPMWRYVAAGIVLVLGIAMYIWSRVLDPSDGPYAGTASAADVLLASRLHLGSLLCLLVTGVLIWWGDRTTLRCPACGYTCQVGTRGLERADRDERYQNLRRGATRSERLGMWLERNTSWASDVGPTEPEQARRPREWYGRYVVVITVVIVALLVAAGFVGCSTYLAGAA